MDYTPVCPALQFYLQAQGIKTGRRQEGQE
jgi:hypothetical protein